MNHLVIGLGEVGMPIYEMLTRLDPADNCIGGCDLDGRLVGDTETPSDGFDMIHVCFPFRDFKTFRDSIDLWIRNNKLIKRGIVATHSTVAVGTTDMLQELYPDYNFVHSPVRGPHTQMLEALFRFTKYLAGKKAGVVAKVYDEIGLEYKILPNPRYTEALKLWDTTQYGIQILLQKEIKKWCDENGLNYELIYKDANESYNAGYESLGWNHVQRPVLMDMPGGIGGHCVVQNAELLGDTELAKLLLSKNKEYSKKKK